MTASSTPPRAPFTVKGWHVAAGVVAFFVVIIGVNAVFLTMAYRTHPGQVAPRPYEAGLLYNAELERLRVQEALGWRAALEARPEAVMVLLRDRDGQPLRGLKVTATLLRPATEEGRSELNLTETAPGQYVGTQAGLSGVFDARVDATGGGHSFVAERRLTWP
jgi:nitrogen fixation protein FixH